MVVVVKWGYKDVHYVPIAEPLTLKKQNLLEFQRNFIAKQPGTKQRTPDEAARAVLGYKKTMTEGARKALEELAGYDLI
jgi:hypothetical protein